ncbi:uncharacterized protein [Choristoneura fumiferana]|uniref:uncharacterized protein n=1 Tax=Choristoneura fumiferana TaxID=7141 RepID=UPI003D15B852
MTDFKITERLYLSREDDIYVDHCQLPQHQIDGVRFLYAQFKKKKPGVILNDPSGYGKTLQVVLFLSAVKRLLLAPALVLVKDDELALWREHFQRWTQLKDDVVFESSNPYLKKAVFVSTRSHAAALARREWTVAVADTGALRDRPQADFKIWLTHADVKEDLYTFSSVYQWLSPKETFNPRDFEANKGDPKDVVAKSLLLDAFFEDKVLRRKNFTPFKKPETYTSLTIEPPKISRKNKDATGTKIKRSKVRIEAETNHAAKIPRIDLPERNSTITSKDYYKERGMDVESFIKNEKPVESDGIEDFVDFQTLMSKSDSNDRTVHEIVTARSGNENVMCNGVNIDPSVKDDMSESVSEVNTADFQDAINDIVRNENDDDSCVRNENKRDEVIAIGNDKNEAIKNDVGITSSKDLDVSVLEETNAETIQDVVNNGSKKDLDSILSDLEEKTLNKFKGSLLDSIF